jgi:hypothetical protein
MDSPMKNIFSATATEMWQGKSSTFNTNRCADKKGDSIIGVQLTSKYQVILVLKWSILAATEHPNTGPLENQ